MAEPEPAVLHDQATLPDVGAGARPEPARPSEPRTADLRPAGRATPTVYVNGFWKRGVAAAIDLAIVIPSAILVTWVVSKLAGVHLPPSNLRLRDIDGWIDLILVTDPALVMGLGLLVAIGLVYALVFHIVLGRTLGMRVLGMKIIDVYGERPSPARCAVRCGGYLLGIATLFLGFLWIGFDSEKRGIHDWIAGTYVIRA